MNKKAKALFNHPHIGLTKGKSYDVLEESENMIFLMDDSGKEYWHSKKRFEILEETKKEN